MKASITNLSNLEEFKLSNNPEKFKDQCFEFIHILRKKSQLVSRSDLLNVRVPARSSL